MDLVGTLWQLLAVEYPGAGMALLGGVILLILIWGVRLSAS